MKKQTFVALRAVHLEKPIPETTVDQCCSKCGSHVVLAPSSQRLLLRDPANCNILCMECFEEEVNHSSEALLITTSGSMEETLEEFRVAIESQRDVKKQ